MMDCNCFRSPPGFGDNRNVSIAIPEISLSNMLPSGEMLCPNPPTPRRKSEAATHADDDSISHHYKGGREKEYKLKDGPAVHSFQVGGVGFKSEMEELTCILPMFSQNRIFKGWILESDCWFMKFGQ